MRKSVLVVHHQRQAICLPMSALPGAAIWKRALKRNLSNFLQLDSLSYSYNGRSHKAFSYIMGSCQFQLTSDLHLETPKAYDIYEIKPSAPYLALLGDIGCVKDEGLMTFLETQLLQFRLVFFLFGNHEPYGKDWAHTKNTMQEFANRMRQRRASNPSLGEFVILDQTRYDISNDVTVLGCTLFSLVGPTKNDMDHVSFGLNDFYDIAGWTVEQHNEAHSTDLRWLNAQVTTISRAEPSRKIVIMTHHSPTQDPRAIDPAHAHSPITSGFSTNMSDQPCCTNPNVRVWMYGHTHFNCDFQLNGTSLRVVTNQRGYYFAQSSGFMADKVIDI
ncbi:hypothetical protein FH972_022905 [Carpinus fangiana]|uniref:Calcineurin-like phosphoesterase domain-containing protein n=1 Tax=Carpinus fangiana TaxID=176857 RepID=A0A5N6KTL6_9ROSI|nr:hypothetical protein FH972_022905 [Carpinus fangiana]